MVINTCFWKIKRKLASYGHYSIIANCRTKMSAVFRGIFGICHHILKCLCIYNKISCRIPNDVLRKTWVSVESCFETLI
jgi:hypothetical protein